MVGRFTRNNTISHPNPSWLLWGIFVKSGESCENSGKNWKGMSKSTYDWLVHLSVYGCLSSMDVVSDPILKLDQKVSRALSYLSFIVCSNMEQQRPGLSQILQWILLFSLGHRLPESFIQKTSKGSNWVETYTMHFWTFGLGRLHILAIRAKYLLRRILQ